MAIDVVSFETDPDTARVFASLSEGDRRKLELLLSLRLRELIFHSSRPLALIMDETSCNAERRGLTPEVLNSLLNDH